MPTICPACYAPLSPSEACTACGWAPPEAATAPYNPDSAPVPPDGETGPAAPEPAMSDDEILGRLALRLPDYRDWERVGRGGMGMVWSAHQPVLDRRVAVKVMLPSLAEREGFAERFEREAQALAKLDHPGIVRVHDFGEAYGVFFLVMEYVPQNLRQYRRRLSLTRTDGGKAVATPDAARHLLWLFEQLCEAVQFAHEKGYIHRDIKPENVLVGKDADGTTRVKLADFGLVRLAGDGFGIGGGSGTAAYMAPEQKRGWEDKRADVYALGVVLFEMLTDELVDVEPLAIAVKYGHKKIRRAFAPRLPAGPNQKLPSEVGLDARLDRILRKATAHDPDDRYPTARRFGAALKDVREYGRRYVVFWDWVAIAATCFFGGLAVSASLEKGYNSASHWNLCVLWLFTNVVADFRWFGPRLLWTHRSLVIGFALALNVIGPIVGSEPGHGIDPLLYAQTGALIGFWVLSVGLIGIYGRGDTSSQRTKIELAVFAFVTLLTAGALGVLYFAPPAVAAWGPAVMTPFMAAAVILMLNAEPWEP